MTATNECKICLETKPLGEFWTRSSNGIKYPFYACKNCYNEKRRNNPEKYFKYKKSPEAVKKRKETVKEERLTNRPKHLFYDCRKADNKRGHQNDLTLQFVSEKLSQPCSYCGATDKDGLITLDRKDNALGHTQDNTVTACYRCNLTRGNMPYEAWLCIAPSMKMAFEKGLFGDWRTVPIARRKK